MKQEWKENYAEEEAKEVVLGIKKRKCYFLDVQWILIMNSHGYQEKDPMFGIPSCICFVLIWSSLFYASINK